MIKEFSRRKLFAFAAALGFGSSVGTTKTGVDGILVTGQAGDFVASAPTDDVIKKVAGYVLDCASTDEKEPGYREWCTAMSDGNMVRVYLDGVYQQHCEAASAKEGWVRRCVVSPESGDIVIDPIRSEILKETVYGLVVIEVTKSGSWMAEKV
jgi:hypothetical protein